MPPLPPNINRAGTNIRIIQTYELGLATFIASSTNRSPSSSGGHAVGDSPSQTEETLIIITILTDPPYSEKLTMSGLPESLALGKKHAITIVRISIETSQVDRLRVDSKPRAPVWAATVDLIKQQPGWRFVFLGEEPEQPAKAVILIGWLDEIAPSPRFSPGRNVRAGPPVLPDLQPHLTGPPEIVTLWHARDKETRALTATMGSAHLRVPGPPPPGCHHGGFAELVRLQGPVDAVRAAIAEIMKSLETLQQARAMHNEGNTSGRYSFLGGLPFILEDGPADQILTRAAKRKGGESGAFAFVFRWASKQFREEFKDPETPNGERPSAANNPRFWEDWIATPLRRLAEEHGVKISSWDYFADRSMANNKEKAGIKQGYAF